MNVSMLIVTRGMTPEVHALARRLADLLGAARSDTLTGEVLIVAENPRMAEVAEPELLGDGITLVSIPAKQGLGYNRNRALEAAVGDTVVFVDDDCWPADDWLSELLAPLADPTIQAVMGNVHIRPSTFVGDSISALGFPAGGSTGFAVMFPVDDEGFTTHISTLNCALRDDTFVRVGPFDESLVFGGEDGELSHRISSAGLRVKFQPTAMVEHDARSSLPEFTRWFFRRGRAAYQFSRRVPAGGTIGRRLASYTQILRMHRNDPKIVAIVPLLGASIVLQQAGFAWEYVVGEESRDERD